MFSIFSFQDEISIRNMMEFKHLTLITGDIIQVSAVLPPIQGKSISNRRGRIG